MSEAPKYKMDEFIEQHFTPEFIEHAKAANINRFYDAMQFLYFHYARSPVIFKQPQIGMEPRALEPVQEFKWRKITPLYYGANEYLIETASGQLLATCRYPENAEFLATAANWMNT